MKLLLCLMLSTAAYAAFYEDSFAQFVKKPSNFKVGYNRYLAGKSLEEIKVLMGVKEDNTNMDLPLNTEFDELDDSKVPKTFDCGDKWKMCNSTIKFIQDQAACGSCWAVAAASVASDRSCIANIQSFGRRNKNVFINEPAPRVDLSGEQMMSCCWSCGEGCQGGYPSQAMNYWKSTGLVTGGWYGSQCGCQPYKIPPCGPTGCGSIKPTPSCSHKCIDGSTESFTTDKHHASSSYRVSSSSTSIMKEIYNNGPVEAAFSVYENFMHYKSGVYDEATGRYLGGHAVKIIGWGSESGTDYWVINNSWNTTWGNNGHFLMKRGNDLCGIESAIVAGKAKTSDGTLELQCQ